MAAVEAQVPVIREYLGAENRLGFGCPIHLPEWPQTTTPAGHVLLRPLPLNGATPEILLG